MPHSSPRCLRTPPDRPVTRWADIGWIISTVLIGLTFVYFGAHIVAWAR